jgi:monoamine oxidase
MNETTMTARPTLASSVDAVVVGAGAAGIAAARHLLAKRPDLSVIVLEAASRIGGRASSVRPDSLGGHAVDLGCGWFHGSRDNEWLKIAQELGFAIDRTPAPWTDPERIIARNKGAEALARKAINGFFERLGRYDTERADAAWSVVVPPDDNWISRFEPLANFLNGADLASSSIADFQNYDPGGGPDLRTKDGYGTVVAAYGRPLNIHLETAVERIEHRGARSVRITTNRGTLNASVVIVTVSTTVLANETIRFDPPVPVKIEAASKLPLGKVNKLFLAVVPGTELPPDRNLMGTHGSGGTASYQIRPFGTAAIEAYFGGQLAEDLERGGTRAATAFAIDELVDCFGSGIRNKLAFAAASSWCADRWIGGGYSYALPGQAGQRQRLAAPIDARLFFAGEACSPKKFSTAHGAYESGIAAAEAAMIGLFT